MFVQIRDFALAMKPVMERMRGDMRILWKLASWLPSCYTGAFLVPRENAVELVGKWTDDHAREAELRAWLDVAMVLIAGAEHMVKIDSVQQDGNCCPCHGRVVMSMNTTVGSDQMFTAE